MLPDLPKLQQPTAHLWVSGQPTAEQFAGLPAAGIRHVINLRPASEEPGAPGATEAQVLGLSYRVLPIAGAADLTLANVERLDALLAEVGDEPTLLHCASGNRVGALMSLRAAWLKRQPIEEALRIGRAHGLTAMEPVVSALLSTAAR